MRLIGVAALLLVGCGKDDSGSDEACPLDVDPTLEIGLSDNGFVPISDGDDGVIVYGPQGGYHVEIAFRAEGLDVTDLVQVVTTGTLDGADSALVNSWEQFRCNPETETADAWNINLIYDSTPGVMHGKTSVIEATVKDAAGTSFTATRTITLVDPEAR